MKIPINLYSNDRGFTLVEVAIVLIIVGLMMSAFLMPLAAQMDLKNYRETRMQMDEIREALIGFALSHSATDGKPYLPCPDTDGDGLEDRVGSGCASQEGDLPIQNLGILGTDAWNNNYIYRVTEANVANQHFANSANGFTLASTGNITVRVASGGSNLVTSIPVIIISKGKNGASAAVNADESENTSPDGTFVSHDFTPTFDDTVVWISPNILFNRMVTAGKLP